VQIEFYSILKKACIYIYILFFFYTDNYWKECSVLLCNPICLQPIQQLSMFISDRAANLDPCSESALLACSREGSFAYHSYRDTGYRSIRVTQWDSYPQCKDHQIFTSRTNHCATQATHINVLYLRIQFISANNGFCIYILCYQIISFLIKFGKTTVLLL
jgi:hypothetical protein